MESLPMGVYDVRTLLSVCSLHTPALAVSVASNDTTEINLNLSNVV